MGNPVRELVAYENKQRILDLALQGIKPSEIADQLRLSPSTVRSHLDQALDEAKEKFVNDSSRLLVKSYLRTEMLIDMLMVRALEGDMAAIDRVDKLISTQVKMLKNNTLININTGDTINNVAQVFRHGSEEFMLAEQLARENPSLLHDPLDTFRQIAQEEGYSLSETLVIDGEVSST